MLRDLIPPPSSLLEGVEIRHARATSHEDINRYTSFTFPRLKFESLRIEEINNIILSAAIKENQLLGLAVSIRKPMHEVQIISFYINPIYRTQGIGTLLMQELINTCRTSNNKTLYLNYKTFWDSNSPWERLLDRTGWSFEETDNLYIRLENGQSLKQVPSLKKLSIPQKFTITHIDDNALIKLSQWANHSDVKIPHDVHPSKNPSIVNPSCSLLLKHNNLTAGWIIGHQIDSKKLQISSLFILPQFRNSGSSLGLSLIAEAVKRNTHIGTTYFGMRRNNTFMTHFVNTISGTYSLHKKMKAIFLLKK